MCEREFDSLNGSIGCEVAFAPRIGFAYAHQIYQNKELVMMFIHYSLPTTTILISFFLFHYVLPLIILAKH